MCSFAAICVNYNLTACKSGVTMRTSDDKLTRRVDEILDIVIEQG